MYFSPSILWKNFHPIIACLSQNIHTVNFYDYQMSCIFFDITSDSRKKFPLVTYKSGIYA